MIATTAERVPANTDAAINWRIAKETEGRIRFYAQDRNPVAICVRLDELDREWDVERCLETGASALVLLGTALGVFKRRWLLLPLGVAGFLMQHALQGWCPPLPVFRALGVRTADEINRERYALKQLLGQSPLSEDKLGATSSSAVRPADAPAASAGLN